MEVKGLKLGDVVTTQSLANLFGTATCPTAEAQAHMHNDVYDVFIFCKVPISYLGIRTSAKIGITESWRVTSIFIIIPVERLSDVETVLAKKYGRPTLNRGTIRMFRLKDPKTGVETGPEIPSKELCSEWKDIEQSNISVCDAFPSPGYSPPGVWYRYRAPVVLDPSDI
ncbi:MAG: hypothetical protein ABI365_09160 [Lysobacteraceae bacterium]